MDINTARSCTSCNKQKNITGAIAILCLIISLKNISFNIFLNLIIRELKQIKKYKKKKEKKREVRLI